MTAAFMSYAIAWFILSLGFHHVRHIKTSSFHFGDQNEWGSRVLTSRRAKPASEELQWRRSSVGAQIRAVHHKDRSYNRDCTYKHHKFWWTLLLSLHSKLMLTPSVSLPIRKLNYRTTPYSFANHKTGDKVEYSLISAYVKHWAHSSLYELETVQSIRVHDDSRVINGTHTLSWYSFVAEQLILRS